MIDITQPIYVLTIAAFVIGLIRMANPATARSGILWAGIAMAFSIGATFFVPGLSNLILIFPAILIGAVIGYAAARKVAIVNMPQMVAIYNGMGAGAASTIAAIELIRLGNSSFNITIALLGAIIGNVSIAGSVMAFLKLQGWIRQKPITFVFQQVINLIVVAVGVLFGIAFLTHSNILLPYRSALVPFFVLTVGYGFLMALPIGGADMPVLISLYNAMTGIAVGLEGFAISNYAMVVAGILVGAAGTILTLAMATAMNRSVGAILAGGFGKTQDENRAISGNLKPISSEDVAVMLAYSSTVAIVPGFGMASAQAQFKVRDLSDMLISKGIKVFFAIHPVAGRMPGHMNVLLAEAGVPYDLLEDRDEANRAFQDVDVSLVIGANDVVNPAARIQGTALFGMPILDVDRSKNVVVLKRGAGKGFAGIENDLFYMDKTKMLYGDAQDSISKVIQELKKL
ncbi:MAG: NAD(P)(+) transhydrogenase (Re/Si-specific) subunit beta [Thermoplasmatales archaeon]|jgi:NAD(P) transhydrogenase subunit beta|nr:NAD(P)(+) transhydrogenase (Re/Si-specific) subunit beta [Candidatus Thermoplasmatota archaeon]MDA8054370.1 NAD(P)(+) transhydrogenase (Re/Si-specific) subunit beta [Thermoplasmatales archaeon]